MWFLSRQEMCGSTSIPASRLILAAVIRLSARVRERGESVTVMKSTPPRLSSAEAERMKEQS